MTEAEGSGYAQDVFYLYSLTTDKPDRGTYEWMLYNPCDSCAEFLETQNFVIGGYKWRLRLFPHVYYNGEEYISVKLVSVDGHALETDITITAVNNMTPQANNTSGGRFICDAEMEYGFSCFQRVADLRQLCSGFMESGYYTLRASLMMKLKKDDLYRQQLLSIETKMVEICVFTDTHLSNESTPYEPFRLPNRVQGHGYFLPDTESLHGFLTTLGEDLGLAVTNIRLWLCERTLDGSLSARTCLAENTTDPSVLFSNLSDPAASNQILTFYLEQAKNGVPLPIVDNVSRIIFFKKLNLAENTIDYLGSLVVRPCTSALELFGHLVPLVELPPGTPFDLYTQMQDSTLHKIDPFESMEAAELSENDVILVCQRQENGPLSPELLQVQLLKLRALKLQETLTEPIDQELLREMEELALEAAQPPEPVAQQEEDEENDSDDEDVSNLCSICLDMPITTGFLHGESVHRCVCETCAALVMEKETPTCPLCREKVDRVVRRFH